MDTCHAVLNMSALQSAGCGLDKGHQGRHRMTLEWDEDGMHPQGFLIAPEPPTKWTSTALPQPRSIARLSAWSLY